MPKHGSNWKGHTTKKKKKTTKLSQQQRKLHVLRPTTCGVGLFSGRAISALNPMPRQSPLFSKRRKLLQCMGIRLLLMSRRGLCCYLLEKHTRKGATANRYCGFIRSLKTRIQGWLSIFSKITFCKNRHQRLSPRKCRRGTSYYAYFVTHP